MSEEPVIEEPVLIFIAPVDEVVTFSLNAHQNTTFLQLKEMIEQKTGVAVIRQMLLHNGEAQSWPDSYTLENAGFKSTAEMGLLVNQLPPGTLINIIISVPASHEFSLIVDDKSAVWELKILISEHLNLGYENCDPSDFLFFPTEIQLFHHFTEMQNHHLLLQYFVNEGSKINMLFS